MRESFINSFEDYISMVTEVQISARDQVRYYQLPTVTFVRDFKDK